MVQGWDTTSSLPCYGINNALTPLQLGMRIKLMNTLSFRGCASIHLSAASSVGFGDYWGGGDLWEHKPTLMVQGDVLRAGGTDTFQGPTSTRD